MKKPNDYWNYEKCKQTVNLYQNYSDFRKAENSCYRAILKNKWLIMLDNLSKNIKPVGYWTKNLCLVESKKYQTRSEFKKFSSSAYKSAYQNKFLDEICSHMNRIGDKFKRLVYIFIFSDNTCYIGITCNSKRRYKDHFNSTHKSPVYYHFLKTNINPDYYELTDYISANSALELEDDLRLYYSKTYNVLNSGQRKSLGGNDKIIYSYDECLQKSMLCKSRTEFARKYSSYYNYSNKNKWLNIFFD